MKSALRIGIVGYGRMGKEVARIAGERGHSVAFRVDSVPGLGDATSLDLDLLAGADGVIEFSLPGAVKSNAELYARAGATAVVGTTNWESDKAEVESLIRGSKAAFLYGSNFSIGAHLFFALAERAAELIKSFEDYDIVVHEFHHKNKVDSPSGTALSLARRILAALPRKKTIQTQALDRAIQPDELHVTSTRGGAFPGTHSVYLDSQVDTIELTHTARGREGLALGAVLALEWLMGKQGVFRVEDFVADRIGR